MENKIKKTITFLKNKAFIYSIDNISFAKSLHNLDFNDDTEKNIVITSEKLSKSLSDVEKFNDSVKIIAELENSLTFVKSNLSILQEIKCSKNLLNEKSDLIITTVEIIETIENIILQINR